MNNINLPALFLFGFLIVWSLMYWIFPLIVVRLREPRKADEQTHSSFLSETGTIHRLGRETKNHTR
jgi:hypothetical protein